MGDEMTEVIDKVLSYGPQANYDAITEKDPLMLYFCTDTRKMYKGDQDYTESVRLVSERPKTPARGVLYIIETVTSMDVETDSEGETTYTPTATSISVEVWNGTAWKTIVPALTDVISKNEADYAEDAPTKIPTMKAIREFVTEATGEAVGKVVTEVTAGTSAGTIMVKVGTEEPEEVQVTGVTTTPEWDPTARRITFPVLGQEDAVVVELGKDIFLDGSKPNGYNKETKKLELYLNDEAETKIEIPVDDLIDIDELEDISTRVDALEKAHGWGTF